MKQFNLEEFKKDPSKKVVTRDGRDVRIICTNKNGKQPIVALVEINGKEDIRTFYPNGRWTNTNEWYLDLFFATIKKEGWVNLFKDEELPFINGDVYENEKDAKEAAQGESDFIATIKIEWEE